MLSSRRDNKYWKKFREFSRSELASDIMVFLFFLIVSTGFWILQKLNDTFEIEVSVPISLVGVPQNVTITTPLPNTITVHIKDRGTQLVSYMRKDFLPINLEFPIYDNGSATGRGHIPLADVQHALNMQLQSSSYIQRITPDTLEFYYNRGLHRRLPVRFVGSATTLNQKYLHDITFLPDSVTVYAPSLVLDSMQAAYTEEQHLTDLSENTTRKCSLRFARGVKYEPSTVTFTAHVDYYTEKTVTVPITGVNFPAGKSLKTFPSSVQITFRVGSLDYADITADNFVLTVSYEELLHSTDGNHHLQLKQTPPEVSYVRIQPADIEFLIEDIDTTESSESASASSTESQQ